MRFTWPRAAIFAVPTLLLLAVGVEKAILVGRSDVMDPPQPHVAPPEPLGPAPAVKSRASGIRLARESKRFEKIITAESEATPPSSLGCRGWRGECATAGEQGSLLPLLSRVGFDGLLHEC